MAYIYLRTFSDIKYLIIKQSNYFRAESNIMKEPLSHEWRILDSAHISQNSRHERLNIIVREKRMEHSAKYLLTNPSREQQN